MAVRRHSLSTKKHNGDLVVNKELDVDSAAVLSLWLRSVIANLCDGSNPQRVNKRPIWASVS